MPKRGRKHPAWKRDLVISAVEGHGKTVDEAAKIAGLPRGTVWTWISERRRRFRPEPEPEPDEREPEPERVPEPAKRPGHVWHPYYGWVRVAGSEEPVVEGHDDATGMPRYRRGTGRI